jgi:paraquat-inducible protein A
MGTAMTFVLPILLVAAPLLFALGITLPLLAFEKLFFFEENPSLVGIVWSLYDNGDVALAALVALFSIVFPFAKMVVVVAEVCASGTSQTGRLARLVPFLTKWSMMDVMLVAIVIAAAKTSGLASAYSEAGLWFYAGSALSISVVQWLVARAKARAA